MGTLRAYRSSSEQAQLAKCGSSMHRCNSCTCISPPAAREQSRPSQHAAAHPHQHATMPAAAHPRSRATTHVIHRGPNIPTATCAALGQDKRGRHRFPCASWLATFPADATTPQATQQHGGADRMQQSLGSKGPRLPSHSLLTQCSHQAQRVHCTCKLGGSEGTLAASTSASARVCCPAVGNCSP